MRISGGLAARTPLRLPKGADIRPTQDRIRQVIFSSLAARVPEARVLDLFAGTGAIGLEALSRGAAQVTFVEKNPACVACLRETLAASRLEAASTRILPQDAWQFLRGSPAQPFDLIFADPPYEKIRATLIDPPLVAAVRPWLAKGGLLIWEHYSGAQVQSPPGWSITRQRTYGETGVTFLTLAAS